VRAYGTQERNFVAICDRASIDLSAPLTEVDLTFVTAVYASSHMFTTVPGFLSAIRQASKRRWGESFELPRGAYFEAHYTGLRNYYGNTAVSTPKAALTLLDLSDFATRMDLRYFEFARDWCACLFAFFGLLRINEYMGGALLHEHVSVTSLGVDLIVLRSKTSNAPAVVSISARDDALCPARAYRRLQGSLACVGLPGGKNVPVFLTRWRLPDGTERGAPMTDTEFIQRVRVLIKAGFPDRDPARYAGHLFRRGGASALLLAGVDPASIQRHGRWTSDAWRGYIDSSDNPALRLLATRALRPHRQ
jgi:hypothetical protein